MNTDIVILQELMDDFFIECESRGGLIFYDRIIKQIQSDYPNDIDSQIDQISLVYQQVLNGEIVIVDEENDLIPNSVLFARQLEEEDDEEEKQEETNTIRYLEDYIRKYNVPTGIEPFDEEEIYPEYTMYGFLQSQRPATYSDDED